MKNLTQLQDERDRLKALLIEVESRPVFTPALDRERWLELKRVCPESWGHIDIPAGEDART